MLIINGRPPLHIDLIQASTLGRALEDHLFKYGKPANTVWFYNERYHAAWVENAPQCSGGKDERK